MKPVLLTVLVVGAALAGCGVTTPERLDAELGNAVVSARAQQTLNPQASQSLAPAAGIDGVTADALVDRYHKGFAQPTRVDIFNIGVGSGSASTLGPSTGVGSSAGGGR